MKHLPASLLLLIASISVVVAAPPPTPQEVDSRPPVSRSPEREAAEAPPVAERSDVLPAGDGAWEAGAWMEQVSASQTVVFRMGDPLPHVERVLSSPSLRGVITQGAVGAVEPGDGQADVALDSADPLSWLAAVLENDRYVPVEVVMAASPQTLGSYTAMLRGLTAAGLAHVGLHDADGNLLPSGHAEEISKEDLNELHRELAEVVAGLGQVQTTVVVTLRDEADAQMALMYAGMIGPMVATTDGVEAAFEADAMRFRVQVGEAVPRPMIEQLILQAELARSIEGGAADVVEAVAGLEMEVSLERRGRTLVLHVGDAAGERRGAALTAEALGPLYDADQPPLMFYHYDLRPLRSEVDRLSTMWDRWDDTPLGERALERGGELMVTATRLYAAYLDHRGTGGSMSMTMDDAAMRLMSLVEGVEEVTPLAQTKLARSIPDDAEAVLLDTTGYVSSWLRSAIGQLEYQTDAMLYLVPLTRALGQQDLGLEVDGEARAGVLASKAALQELRERVPEVMGDGLGVVVTTRGRLRLFEVVTGMEERQRGGQGKDGQGQSLTVRGAAVPEVAVLMEVSDPGEAMRLGTDVFETTADWVDAMVALEGVEGGLGVPRGELQRVDLGLGEGVAATYDIDLSPIGEALLELMSDDAGDGAGFRATMEGDTDLHVMFPDERHAVVSTSPRLSRELVTSWGPEAGAGGIDLGFPKLDAATPMPGGDVVSYVSVPSATAARLLDDMAAMVEGAWVQPETDDERETRMGVATSIRGLGELIQLTQGLQGQMTQRDGRWMTVVEVRVKE